MRIVFVVLLFIGVVAAVILTQQGTNYVNRAEGTEVSESLPTDDPLIIFIQSIFREIFKFGD